MAEGDRTADPGGGGRAAAELLRAVRVHLDRVSDAVLRTGCSAEQAAEVVRDTTVELVERVAAGHPGSTAQAVGGWFGDALARGRDAAGPGGEHPAGADDGPDAALGALPEPDRSAVLLRDGYDLPVTVVAAALGSTVDETQDVLARGRLALPGGDAGRNAPPLSGLVVAALPEPDRSRVLRAVEERAAQRLPAAAAPLATAAPATAAPATAAPVADGPVGAGAGGAHVETVLVDEPPPRLLSPLLAVLSVVLAVLAGVGVGLLLSAADDVEPLAGADGEIPPGVVLVTPQPSPPAPPPSPPTAPEQRPETRVVVVPPSPLPTPTPTPTPTPSPTPTPTPALPPTLALSPASGPNGSTVIVTGAGFAPGAQVRIDYLDTEGEPTGSGAVAVADADGSVSTELSVQDPDAVPGPHDVVATAGDVSARATFTAQE